MSVANISDSKSEENEADNPRIYVCKSSKCPTHAPKRVNIKIENGYFPEWEYRFHQYEQDMEDIMFHIPMITTGNDICRMKDLLEKGYIDFERTYRRRKYIIDFVISREMLTLLISFGLNLLQGRPLLRCKFEIFELLLEEYSLDPFPYFHQFTNKRKIYHLNKFATRARYAAKVALNKTGLIEPLIDIIVLYMFNNVDDLYTL